MVNDKRAFAPFGVDTSPSNPTSRRSDLCTRGADVIYRPQDMCGQELGAYADPSGDRNLAIQISRALSAGGEIGEAVERDMGDHLRAQPPGKYRVVFELRET